VILMSIDSGVLRRAPGSLHIATAAIALALFLGEISIGPNFNVKVRTSYIERLQRAVLAASNRRSLGDPMSPHADVRAAQQDVPPGVRLGFWGKDAALLDFRRNKIRDLSWPPALTYNSPFMGPIWERSLPRVDYLVVEDIDSLTVKDSWGDGHPYVLEDIESKLEPGPEHGIARVYRVKR
jgi:hypothetical protein